MSQIADFFKEFTDNVIKMFKIAFYGSCGMLFVAGLLMGYMQTPFVLAMSIVFLPLLIVVIVAALMAYYSVKRGYV